MIEDLHSIGDYGIVVVHRMGNYGIENVHRMRLGD